MITRAHVLRLIAQNIDLKAPAREIMKRDIITISPDTEVQKLITWNVSSLPVIDQDKLVGIVTLSDTIRAYYKSVVNIRNTLDTVISSIRAGIISINEEGIIKVINPAAEAIFGVKKDDILGQRIQAVLPQCRLFRIIERAEHEYGVMEMYNNRSYLCNRSPILENGQIIGAVEVIQDISEIEMLSAKLKSTQELMQRVNAIIECSFDGIFVTDHQGNIIKANESYLNLAGVSESDVIGKNINELESDLFDPRLIKEVAETKQAATIVQQLKSGKNVIITANPIIDDNGTSHGVVANVRDITELNALKEQINSLNQHYIQEINKYKIANKYIFSSPKSRDLIDLVIRVAQVDSTVLITGETGVGKDVIAQILHENSPRSDKPFVRINCGAIPETLLESELFGYEPGSFTGARKGGKMGLFEVANHGILFLDEIRELPIVLQVKLLRVLQDGKITRIGGTVPKQLDVRVIAATNRSLSDMVLKGKFREDLYYRLNVVPITVPPLRERVEEIPEFVNFFLSKYNKKYGMNKSIDARVISEMQRYKWPGNIRELENVIERAIVTSKEDVITDIRLRESDELDLDAIDFSTIQTEKGNKLKATLEVYEKRLLQEALKKYGSTRKTAQVLGVDQSTIVKKAARYNIPLRNK